MKTRNKDVMSPRACNRVPPHMDKCEQMCKTREKNQANKRGVSHSSRVFTRHRRHPITREMKAPWLGGFEG